MSLALIDADIVAFRATAGTQTSEAWGDGPPIKLSDPTRAAANAIRMVHDWTRLARCSDAVCCFSSGANFRYAIYAGYKANRKALSKPDGYQHVVDAITAEFTTHTIAGLEADDVMGILGTSPDAMWRGAVIVTMDKDLKTVPGMHFNPFKDTRPYRISPAAAMGQWCLQTLMGDATDCIKGIPGVGPVKAAALLVQHGADMRAVAQAYADADVLGEFVLNARLTRILQHADYNPTDGTIALWHPTSPIRHKLNERTTATSAVAPGDIANTQLGGASPTSNRLPTRKPSPRRAA